MNAAYFVVSTNDVILNRSCKDMVVAANCFQPAEQFLFLAVFVVLS